MNHSTPVRFESRVSPVEIHAALERVAVYFPHAVSFQYAEPFDVVANVLAPLMDALPTVLPSRDPGADELHLTAFVGFDAGASAAAGGCSLAIGQSVRRVTTDDLEGAPAGFFDARYELARLYASDRVVFTVHYVRNAPAALRRVFDARRRSVKHAPRQPFHGGVLHWRAAPDTDPTLFVYEMDVPSGVDGARLWAELARVDARVIEAPRSPPPAPRDDACGEVEEESAFG